LGNVLVTIYLIKLVLYVTRLKINMVSS